MTCQLKETVLAIWIPKQALVAQGKFCYLEGKPCFIANMTERKLWRNYGGYSISRRLLEKLPRGTRIIYKRPDLNTYYTTNKNRIQTKGVLVNYGSHTQWVLPLRHWKVFSGTLENEPKDLPVTDLEKWDSEGGADSGSGQLSHWASIPEDRWEALRYQVKGC